MKWVFFLLLAANLGLAGYVYVNERSPNPDAQILMQQMNATSRTWSCRCHSKRGADRSHRCA